MERVGSVAAPALPVSERPLAAAALLRHPPPCRHRRLAGEPVVLARACAQSMGFNRSFCGKNATVYGKGVYFARDAGYSARRTYSKPNAKGIQHMFLVRVTVGEYCLGKRDALTPDIRTGHKLYDSTVNSTSDPVIFVTYHDAQAHLCSCPSSLLPLPRTPLLLPLVPSPPGLPGVPAQVQAGIVWRPGQVVSFSADTSRARRPHGTTHQRAPGA